jgi:hypothetical protein
MATLEITEPLASPGLQIISGSTPRRRSADRGVVHARSQDGLQTWTYTSTLSENFDHPEILVVGLDPFLANSVITHLSEVIASGVVFKDGSTVETALPDLSCVFRRMAPTAAAILMPAVMMLRTAQRPTLQLIYPDQRNRLPWQLGHNPSWRVAQPLFLAGEPLGEIESHFLEAAMHQPLLADRRRQPFVRGELVEMPR